MRKKVLVVGNPLLREDNLPLRIMPSLREARADIEFEPFEPTREDIPHNEELVLLDCVAGLEKVRVLDDISRVQASGRAFSLHDYDLGAQLALLSKFGMLGKTIIIGVPQSGEEKKIAEEVLKKLGVIFPRP